MACCSLVKAKRSLADLARTWASFAFLTSKELSSAAETVKAATGASDTGASSGAAVVVVVCPAVLGGNLGRIGSGLAGASIIGDAAGC